MLTPVVHYNKGKVSTSLILDLLSYVVSEHRPIPSSGPRNNRGENVKWK